MTPHAQHILGWGLLGASTLSLVAGTLRAAGAKWWQAFALAVIMCAAALGLAGFAWLVETLIKAK